MNIEETENGVILRVYVKPRSNRFKIVVDGDEVLAFCREEPVEGKVNRELVKESSKFFHKKVELVSGFSSKQKLLLIREVTKRDVERTLLSC